MQEKLVEQLDAVLAEYNYIMGAVPRNEYNRVPQEKLMHVVMRARAAIHRIAGRASVYVQQCEEIVHAQSHTWQKALQLAGVINSLRTDLGAGYLQSYAELIHRDLFADFMEMSQHLHEQGYKDAAAVIAGSSLEAHLRQLCQKAGLDPDTETGSPKKADRLNAELAGANVYSKGDQKNVTAWLDLRNKAAHGHYDQYQAGQVALLIAGVRDFITRHPA